MIYAICALCLCLLGLLLIKHRVPEIPVQDMHTLCHMLRQTTRQPFPVHWSDFSVFGPAIRAINGKRRRKEELFSFEKWLLDNDYSVQRATRQVRATKWHRLPFAEGLPRIVLVARYAVTHGIASDSGRLREFLMDLQHYAPLYWTELSTLPVALCLAACEQLTALYARSIQYARAKKMAVRKRDVPKAYLDAYLYYRYANGYPKAYAEQVLAARERFFADLVDCESKAKQYLGVLDYAQKMTVEYLMSCSTVLPLVPEVIGWAVESQSIILNRISYLSERCNITESGIVQNAKRIVDESHSDLATVLMDKKAMVLYSKRGVVRLQKSTRVKQHIYIVVATVLSLVLCALPLVWSRDFVTLAVAPLMFLPAFRLAQWCIQRVWRAKPRPIMRMGYAVVPEDARTLVVVSRYIDCIDTLNEAAKHLRLLQEKGENIEYCMLIDFPASSTEWSDTDQALQEAIQALAKEDGLMYAVRNRVLQDGRYVAKERKRGAIMDLMGMLISGDAAAFRYVSYIPQHIQFAVLLDDDSRLLPGGILDAVNTMLHPANSHYDILTFDASINLFSIRSRFSRRYAREGAACGYPVCNDWYDAHFGTALYCGKAIVRVQPYFRALQGKLPEKRVLSHDLLEGALLCTGALHRPVFEDAPLSFLAHADRLKRWQRGDMLLLPFLSSKGKDALGQATLYKMQPIYRFLMFSNALATLADFGLLFLVFYGLLVGRFWMVYAALATLSLPPIWDIACAIVHAHGIRLRYTVRKICNTMGDWLERLLLLPYYAWQGVSLFFATIFRSMFSKKSLLVWKPFFRVQKNKNVLRYITLFMPSKIALLTLAILSFDRYFVLFAGLYFLAVWIYYFMWPINAPKLDKGYVEALRKLADSTYRYFCDHAPFGLIRDTLQIAPPSSDTAMTSPTDMGFCVLAHACAILLGADANKALDRMASNLAAISKCDRWHGHLYNWYSLDGKVLGDTVSTVDSANFVSCMLVAKGVALQYGRADIAKVCDKLSDADFGVMYDRERDLLVIAKHAVDGTSEGHYDTLASEARLAYYLAIGQGLPIRSYYNLSRDITPKYGNTILSWGGTAFEYLLPRIFVQPPFGSLVKKAEENAVRIQGEAAIDGIFGISESCCLGFNDQMRYRYQANGLDGLALHPDCGEHVYSPYAAALAMSYNPNGGAKALLRFAQEGMEGQYGLYEAYQEGKCIKTFMAHHQGMLLAAITNALCDNALCEYYAQSPRVSSALLLLCEGTIKRRAHFRSVKKVPAGAYRAMHFVYPYPRRAAHILVSGDTRAVFLGDGRQEVLLHGNLVGGVSIGKNYDLDRMVEVRIMGEERTFSPYPTGKGNYSFETSGGGVLYRNLDENVYEEVRLLPDGNSILHDLCIHNGQDCAIDCEVSSYQSLSLCDRNAYVSHPAFCSLFVKTKIGDGVEGYRLTQEGKVINRTTFTVHGLEELRYTTNRLQALYRNERKVRFAYSQDGPKQGDVLYPCVAYIGRCTIPPKTTHHIYYVCRMTNDDLDEAYRKGQEMYNARIMPYLGMAECLSQHSKLFDKYASQKVCEIVASCLLDSYTPNALAQMEGEQPMVLAYSGDVRADLDRAVAVRLLSAWQDCRMSLVVADRNTQLCARIAGSITKDYVVFEPRSETWKRAYYLPCVATAYPKSMYDSGEGYYRTPLCYVVKPFGQHTAMPYSNVVSNGKAGFLVTENGGGYFFGANSRQDKWTLWRNDPIWDTPTHDIFAIKGEYRYRLNDSRYCVCEHGGDYTSFCTSIDKTTIKVVYRVSGGCVAIDVEQVGEPLGIVFSFVPILDWHCNAYCYVKKCSGGTMTIVNAVTKQRINLTCPRAMFFTDEKGLDIAVMGQKPKLDRIDKVGLYRQSARFTITLGKKEEQSAFFYRLVPPVRLDGSIPLNLLLQGVWRQAVNSRIMARTGFYQCGGAYGYRDQLQDFCAYLYADADYVRQMLLVFAAHQYAEGDVMHWWHSPKTGVRTKVRDDRLFLCYAVAKYVRITGDTLVLHEKVPFLVSEALKDDEASRYETPSESRVSYALLEHIKRAVYSVLQFGRHDLLLVGGGDWNDGIQVGLQGVGESVWLSMFAYMVLVEMKDLCRDWADWIAVSMARLKKGIVTSFDCDRFVAYYTDAGKVIGNGVGPCSLYLLTQAFAAFCGAVEPRVAKVAVDTAKQLVDYDASTVALFHPPFCPKDKVGYIAAYPKGVRENGGQYTHAAVWYVKALLAVGEYDYAFEVLQLLNPVLKCTSHKDAKTYRVEPYVLAADVYTAEHSGQGGWSWYSGSAGWMFCVIVEDIFGVHIRNGKLYLDPHLPSALQNSTLYFSWKAKHYTIRYEPADAFGITTNLAKRPVEYVDLESGQDGGVVTCKYKISTK